MASVMYVLIAKVSYEAIQAVWTISPIAWNFVIFLCWQSREHGIYVFVCSIIEDSTKYTVYITYSNVVLEISALDMLSQNTIVLLNAGWHRHT